MNHVSRLTKSKANGQSLAALYELDETAWLEESSRRIRDGRVDKLDYENLASYLDDMARSERRELVSRLETLLAHLLKWQFQPDKRTPSWERTVAEQRRRVKELLTKTLRRHAEEVLAKCYRGAVEDATIATGLPRKTFAAKCPFTLDEILTEELT